MFALSFSLKSRPTAELWDTVSGVLYQFHSEGIDEGEEAAPGDSTSLLAGDEGDEFEKALAPGVLLPPLAFKAYFKNKRDAESALRAASSFLKDLLLKSEIEEVIDQDYTAIWKANFKPTFIPPFWLIHASWHSEEEKELALQKCAAENKKKTIPLCVEPGMAFGTGSHETTRSCLELIAKTVETSKSVTKQQWLDFGCGSGILAIALKKLKIGQVTAIDIDPLSITATFQNAEVNGVEIDARESKPRATSHEEKSSDKQTDPLHGKFDGIVANILRDTLLEFAPFFHRWLRPKGLVILSGLLLEQEGDVLAGYQTAGFKPVDRIEAKDSSTPGYTWITLVLKRG